MEIIKERFEDASEPDENGGYEYWYSGIIYEFVFPDIRLSARQYDGESEASFQGQRLAGKWETFDEIPYGSHDFQLAVRHLIDCAGVMSIKVFVVNRVVCFYIPVDLERLGLQIRGAV